MISPRYCERDCPLLCVLAFSRQQKISLLPNLWWNYTCIEGSVNKEVGSRLIGIELIEELLKLFLGGESGLPALVWLL